jgi:arginine-tRNA-protein transferase
MDPNDDTKSSAFEHSSAKNRLPQSLPVADTLANEHECSYLPSESANLPLHLPTRRLTSDEFDAVLDQGVRRSGYFLYYAACPNCKACEPSRVNVHTFRWRTSFRRVLNRGDRSLAVQISRPRLDEDRLALFNLHRSQRGLGDSETEYYATDYENFLIRTCCSETLELSFWHEDQLIAVSIVDCGKQSLSAVYTYFDPAYARFSLGTYAILKLLQFAKSTHRIYVYLGMYVAQNAHLNYKARFTPQERFVDGRWLAFDEDI